MGESTQKIKGMFILIIMLSLLVLGLGGYFVYDKFIANNDTEKTNTSNDNNSNENNNNEELNLNENLVINLTAEENNKIYDIFAELIDWNWGYERWENNPKTFTYFTTDLSRATAVFFNNSLVSKTVETTAGSGSSVCYKFDELNDLSSKVFGQGMVLNIIKDSFHQENAPEGYLCYDGGTISIPKKIEELRLNEKTNVYTLKIVFDSRADDMSTKYSDMLYEFNFKIDDGLQLKNLKFENLTNLSGNKVS